MPPRRPNALATPAPRMRHAVGNGSEKRNSRSSNRIGKRANAEQETDNHNQDCVVRRKHCPNRTNNSNQDIGSNQDGFGGLPSLRRR